MNKTLISCLAGTYRHVLKPIFFQVNPELVHQHVTKSGEILGKFALTRNVASSFFSVHDPRLSQTIAGMHFKTPLGLAAGFDYEARLTQITPPLGFGFHTVGTITNKAYGGNPGPLLGRLPKSKSLMVNKGFKNHGAVATSRKLSALHFDIPVGVSIGRTNSADLDQEESVQDILNAFMVFEKLKVSHSYYELNISCPNLFGDVSFYPVENLDELLREVDKLHLKRPVFIKMPIEKPNTDVLSMLEVIAKHSPAGVIFGNLQKDRNNPALYKDEVKKFKVGNFSGKPTFSRSNELIGLAYTHYKDRFIIIGCGGVFSAEDAIEKMKLGASLVQMITGVIFQGPQVISQINMGLLAYLKKNNLKNVSDITGSYYV